MALFFPRHIIPSTAMVFVDGENLSIRYGERLQSEGRPPPEHVAYEPNVFVWSVGLNQVCFQGGVLRKYYYTSVQGDEMFLTSLEERLKGAGIEAPRVFKRTKARGSKQVDISLTTEMLTHAALKNYDVAVLVAGDEDYAPLVEAVKALGRRVFLWFLEDGLSPVLRRRVDHYADIGEILFSQQVQAWR